MIILKDGEYYGQIKTEFRTNEYILSQYSYDIPRTDWHYHEDPYFMYLLQGKVFDVNQKRETRCNAGTLLFHNWQEKHFNSKYSKEAKGFHIELKQESLNQLLENRTLLEGSNLVKDPDSHILIGKIYHEFMVQDSFSKIGIDSLIIQLVDGINKNISIKANTSKWLHELTNIVYEEKELQSLKELSERLGVHPVHISRTFSKLYGCTLSEYIRMVKVKKSIPLILTKKLSLGEIAYMCGFSDQSHFSRTFKYYFRVSPNRYNGKGALKC
ncbi:helix-turn-helix transcriptional regulator [Saprospiraceae bacterium]|nr:helix-turn-helix transcriptional regulator [Saprospiraceae bacterium]